ncbi:MAG: T9SS type A sorting domain-containing protein [Candidatus Fermentibacter sp.]|nr:T9SS type A sorting domain-containing protein [Candidatus Fermentibacter sp.]
MGRLAAILLLFSTLSFSDSEIQTDWSGGPGTPGPVGGWYDSFKDEIAADWWGSPGSLLLGHGRQYDIGSGCCQIGAADFDGDGDLDAAASCNWINAVVWWENLSGGTGWMEHVIAGCIEPEGLTVGDFDSDGDCDVAAASETGNSYWYENSSGGSAWTIHGLANTGSNIRTLDAGDVDGDGDIDIQTCIELSDDVVYWQNTGQGMEWSRYTVDPDFDGAWASVLADIDGDGDLDIAATRRSYTYENGEIHWWENSNGSGTSWSEHVVDATYIDPRSITAGDVDGDGDIDLASTSFNFYNGLITWWANADGSGESWYEHTICTGFNYAHSVTLSDFDGDGDCDVAGASIAPTNDVVWWRNLSGTGTTWESAWLATDMTEARTTLAADFTSDGRDDLMAAGSENSVIWDMTGRSSSGSLTSSILDAGWPGNNWVSISWTGDQPAGTSIGFQVWATDQPYSPETWSDTLWSPSSLVGVVPQGTRYFQYRIVMTSNSLPQVTPVLFDVQVTWNPLGIGQEEQAGIAFDPVSPNPAHGRAFLSFELPAPGTVEFDVFDSSGRLVASRGPQEYAQGGSSIGIGDLPPGVYSAVMVTGDFRASRRFVIID